MSTALALSTPRLFACSRAASDAELIESCKAGQSAAYGALHARHKEKILNLAYQLLGDRDEAEDATQEAFTQAFRVLGSLREQAQFSTWLCRITINLCLARKRCSRQHPEEILHEELGDAGGDAAARAEMKLAVDSVLGQLSPPLRVVLVLRDMQELSYEEIAAVLSIPVGTVRSRLHEARRQFRNLWGAL